MRTLFHSFLIALVALGTFTGSAQEEQDEPMSGRRVIETQSFPGEARITRVVTLQGGACEVYYVANIPGEERSGEQKMVCINEAFIRENGISAGKTFRCTLKVTRFRVLTAKGLGDPKTERKFVFPDFHAPKKPANSTEPEPSPSKEKAS